ncbi:hypothetical protein J3R83DRAFT_3690 [Lanmaoa asiatica]|nr:hypothetical protein J3R83DRAFT_3690 [Lanmaoa asiatica]
MSQPVGVGTSSSYTSLNGASLMVSWNGTGIDLIGSVANALYNVSLDGMPSAYFADPSNTILASFNDLENTNHSLLLTTIITNTTSPDAFLAFNKARITYAPPAGFVNTTATSQAVADSDIAFMGLWSYVTDSTGNSMHFPRQPAVTDLSFVVGSAVTIYGLTSSYSGNFTVTLDNITTNLSALSSYNNSDALLFYATDLPQGMVHHIAVINQENRTLALRVGGVNITSFGNSTTSPTTSSSSNTISSGTIAAVVLAAVLFLVIVGIFYYVCCVRRKARAIKQHTSIRGTWKRSDEKGNADVERITNISPPSGEELEYTSLSTGKGYGFGLGLRRGFPFAYRKGKIGSSYSGRSRNGIGAQAESYPMTPQCDRDEKRFSINTLTENLPVLAHAPESEKLAPGWCNPVARTPSSFKYDRRYKKTPGILLPGLCVEQMGLVDEDNDDDADIKTLTSRQDETLAATLSLSPRTSEALAAFDGVMLSKPDNDVQDGARWLDEKPFLQVRDTSPFRVDVSTIFGTRKGNCDSRTSGSSSSTWSKVRDKLYRRAHRDDGRQSYQTDRREASGSSGPESVPVVMHESGSANPPSETAPGSGTYSFLDLTSSRVSLRRHSKTTTLSSTPAEIGHGVREVSAWSENTSIRMVRIERSRDNILAPKPDAPSTASGGSHPSDNSGTHTAPSAPTIHTQTSSAFPFPITIPASTHIAHPSDPVPERHITPSPLHTPPSKPDQYLQVPQIAPPELALTPTGSPTESVPFSVSEIHFRHSFSEYAGLDSRRASDSSVLPPHPPLPHLDGSQATYSPPPPYIVQRVLGLPMSPLSHLSPTSASQTTLHSPTDTVSSVSRPGTAPTQLGPPYRVGSLLGPRPRPSTAGSIRVSAAPQLPMQGGRGSLRGQR